MFWEKINHLIETSDLKISECNICSKFEQDGEELCSWPCPRTYPIITQSPTWQPLGVALPMSFETNQNTPRFRNWETSLYCRFIPAESKLFHEFCFKFQKDLKKTPYSLSLVTFRSFLSMRRQVNKFYNNFIISQPKLSVKI